MQNTETIWKIYYQRNVSTQTDPTRAVMIEHSVIVRAPNLEVALDKVRALTEIKNVVKVERSDTIFIL